MKKMIALVALAFVLAAGTAAAVITVQSQPRARRTREISAASLSIGGER
jgi:hypothetical protein